MLHDQYIQYVFTTILRLMPHLMRPQQMGSAYKLLGPFESEVEVAEGPGKRVHDFPNRNFLSGVSHVDDIAQLNLPRRWLVCPGHVAIVTTADILMACDGVQSLPGDMQCQWISLPPQSNLLHECDLPECPQAIHHAMVDPEGWVAWRGEEVTSGITTCSLLARAQPT